jgi:uncharacterized protein
LYEKLIEISKKYQKPVGCHGYEHTDRVIKICKLLGDKLKANMEILLPAAILHDVGRGNDSHALKGATMAQKILDKLGYKYVDDIVYAIKVHSFSEGLEAKTLESQILSDADKLDAMGAIGVYRVSQYGVEHNQSQDHFIKHFYDKLLTLRDQLYTDEAKKLAEKRHRFMLEYLKQLKKELKGLS